jgi:hypothetical protein
MRYPMWPKNNKNKHMKLIFSLFLIICFSAAYSQTITIADSIPVKGKLPFNQYDVLTPVFKSEKRLVYQLPVDGMPALRPDTSMRYNMPVANGTWRGFTTGPSIQNFKPLITLDKNGEKFIITPEGPIKIKTH